MGSAESGRNLGGEPLTEYGMSPAAASVARVEAEPAPDIMAHPCPNLQVHLQQANFFVFVIGVGLSTSVRSIP